MWEAIKDWIFEVIQFFYNICGDWGLAIIIVTIIFRILVSPLMHRQAKSNYQMQKIQPMIANIQKKYANDQARQQQELQKAYANAHFNPLMGCIPMLLQMPIFIALFQTLRSIGERTNGDDYSFYGIIPDLTETPSGAFAQGFVAFIPYVILMIIFAGATFVPMIINQLHTQNNPQKRQTYIMSGVMSLFMLWISWSSPAGVLLYWGTSSLIAIAQNQWSYSRCRRKDREKEEEEALEVKPVEVNVTRKVKKKRPTKKS
ncbi:MAG: YidC/Oxa1 family membrane protein insertase [Eggerthellaceae bacterium]|nr:YidC/Oxa1 family membrane protein insertase [Eggerthellaceae bacterium]